MYETVSWILLNYAFIFTAIFPSRAFYLHFHPKLKYSLCAYRLPSFWLPLACMWSIYIKLNREYGQSVNHVSHSNSDTSTLQLSAPKATNLPASHPQIQSPNNSLWREKKHMHDFRLLPWSRWTLYSSGKLCSIFLTDVLRQPIGSIFNSQVVQYFGPWTWDWYVVPKHW